MRWFAPQCVSELQGTHIFLVVVSQGKFSLWQHELPLQKLCVIFSFLPQHPLVETCCHANKICWVKRASDLTQEFKQYFAKSDILVIYHFLALSLFLSSACGWGSTSFVFVLRQQTDTFISCSRCVRHLWCMKVADTWFLLWIPSFHI